jgi:hypothetical protein
MPGESEIHCSFCRKSSAVVSKMIGSPGDAPKSYICDECIQVCASILEDEGVQVGHPIAIQPDAEASALLNWLNVASPPFWEHPLAPQLLSSIEVWIRQESLGKSAADELAKVRKLELRMIAH